MNTTDPTEDDNIVGGDDGEGDSGTYVPPVRSSLPEDYSRSVAARGLSAANAAELEAKRMAKEAEKLLSEVSAPADASATGIDSEDDADVLKSFGESVRSPAKGSEYEKYHQQTLPVEDFSPAPAMHHEMMPEDDGGGGGGSSRLERYREMRRWKARRRKRRRRRRIVAIAVACLVALAIYYAFFAGQRSSSPNSTLSNDNPDSGDATFAEVDSEDSSEDFEEDEESEDDEVEEDTEESEDGEEEGDYGKESVEESGDDSGDLVGESTGIADEEQVESHSGEEL